MNTQRGIGGRWEVGSYRGEQKGSILSVTAVKTTTAVSHIDSIVYEVCRFTSASVWSLNVRSWSPFGVGANAMVRG